jgi:predicted HAD superfamily Cof-like phosphohydrolase
MSNSKKSIEQKLLDFQEKFGHYVRNQPSVNVPPEVKQLRRRLIMEEFEEMMEGLHTDNLIEIADGAADLVYVVVGACTAYGIPFDRIFNEVHNSNMTKTAAKVELGQKYGIKTPKGSDYKAPDIDGILRFPGRPTELELLDVDF